MKRHLAFVLSILILTAPLAAQPLADRVPEEAMIYIGWCGTEAMPPEYSQSNLKAVLDSSNVRKVFSEFLPQLLARVAVQEPEAGAKLDVVAGLIGPLLKHPTAIYFAGVDLDAAQPKPRLALICKAGDDMPGLTQRLGLVKQFSNDPSHLNWVVADDIITIVIGGTEPMSIGKGLAQSQSFKDALAKTQQNPCMVFYADAEKLIGLVDQAVQRFAPPEATNMWPKIRDASGIAGVKRIIATGGFDGKDWSDRLFVAAPSPRKGLVKLGEAAPIPDELLKLVPATATTVSAGAFDLAQFITEMRTIAGEVDPRAQGIIDQGLGFVQMTLGKNLTRDVLEPLGPHWVCYDDPSIAGLGFVGMVLVNKLDDPAKASEGIDAIGNTIKNLTGLALHQQGMSVTTEETTVGDVKVKYLAMPLVSPAWTIKNGNLYVALYPQVAASAARFAASGKPSILDNADFVNMRKRLNAGNATGVQFVDLRRTAPQGYQVMLMLSRLALGMADMWGVKSPELVVPTLEDLMKNMAPAGSVTWVDDTGFYVKHVSPFPAAEVVAGGPGGIMPILMAAGIAGNIQEQAAARARRQEQSMRGPQHSLRTIHAAALLYASEHEGKFPANAAAMKEFLEERLNQLPATGRTLDELLDSPNGKPHLFPAEPHYLGDFLYFGFDGAKRDLSADIILALDAAEVQQKDHSGTTVLYWDGRVEWLNMKKLEKALAESKQVEARSVGVDMKMLLAQQ